MSLKSPLSQRPDYLVCTCMGVMYSELLEAIQAGDTTFKALSNKFGVGTGCSSCVDEVVEMLNDYAKEQDTL
ncbi:hypothetical protein Noda2021_02270 [Candidatus Dependentiae bacterium Noda2021]|nr:hypothetical protein Noda2021_02270 [Candidatus Dependentiae bacterium Noda2021]